MRDLSRRSLILGASAAMASTARPPSPYGATPSSRQLGWASLEYYNFIHFTINTFTGKEWGDGNESPALFNPTSFDADAIAENLKASGSRGFILTCKHHDGFCLWPTKTTDRCIRNSPYRNGKGDIVRELSDAAHRHGMKFGIYVSPWDRSQATYGTPAYIDIYRRQLQELLTGYGPIFEVWHDGANGGSGYYGGAGGVRTIDKRSYYDWPHTWELERKLQPAAAIFSDVGPDVRWVGNEKGIAGETCWATYTPRSPQGGPGAPGDIVETEATQGTLDGKFWMPAECDVSIRPGWFWHEEENNKVKSPSELMDLFLKSTGRGASFLLNVPPDRRGLIAEPDQAALREFGRILRTSFQSNVASGAVAEASNVRGGSAAFHARNLMDGRNDTYWGTDDGVTTATATMTLRTPTHVRHIRLREYTPLGQRVRQFSIDAADSGSSWIQIATGTSIGICRIFELSRPVMISRIRLRIEQSSACPALSELAVFE